MKMCIYNFVPFNQQTVDPSFYFFLLLLPGGRAFFFLGMDQYNSNIIIIIIFKRPVKMTWLSPLAHIISKSATVFTILLEQYARKRATSVLQVNRSVLCQVTTCFRKIIMKLKVLQKINCADFIFHFLNHIGLNFPFLDWTKVILSLSIFDDNVSCRETNIPFK